MPEQNDSGSAAHLLSASVYGILRDRIFTGELLPGQSLSVPRLAAELEVSRSPVREAVQQLIFDRLAVHVPFAGAKVAELDEQAVEQVLVVREVLDGLAARLAVPMMTSSDLRRLQEMLAQQRDALDQPEPDSVAMDMAFHRFIADRSGNVPLADALARLESLSHVHQQRMWRESENHHWSLREHERIARAIIAGDADSAEGAARRHVAAIRVRLTRT